MGTRYERNLPNNAYQAATNANSPSNINPFATIDDLSNGNDGDTILISGGASYSGTGLDFDVTVLVYKIAGVEYTTAATTVTLPAADPTNPRFDAIVASIDASDNPIVEIVQGTPAAQPATPALEADQVLVQYVLLNAGATTPNITTEFVYRDDGVSDWIGSSFGGFGTTANFVSGTPSPVQGSACTLSTFGRYGLLRGTRFTAPTPINRADYSTITFQVYLVDDLAANDITIFYLSAYSADPTTTGVYLGVIPLQNYINFSLVGQWQQITVPTALWTQNLGTATEIGFINFTIYKTQDPASSVISPTLQVAFDDIKFQTGFPSNPDPVTIDILENSTFVGSTSKLGFRNSTTATSEVVEDVANNRIDVAFNVIDSYFGTENSRTIVNVTDASDLPTALVANTTYIIRGTVSTSTTHTCNVDGVEILGLDRTVDILEYTGADKLFSITDCDFTVRQLGFRDTGSAVSIIEGTNYTAGVSANNYGRTKVVQIFGCEFRGCNGLVFLKGYELVDLNNSLFWYHTGPTGLRFRDVRHLEISSCEMYNWYDEATATTYSTASMIELLGNGPDNVGFAVVNINSSIIHPEQTQVGLDVNSLSTTRFGTIASNTFIDVGVTTGGLFLPINASLLPDYSQTYTANFDVFANQGLLNSTAGSVTTMQGNSNDTAFGASSTPVIMQVGGGGSAPALQAAVRMTLDTATGRVTYTGTKQIYVSMHLSLNYEKQGGGSGVEYQFYFYKNGSALPGGDVKVEGTTGDLGALSMNYGVLLQQNDYIEIFVANNTNTNGMLTKDYQLVIRE